MIATHESHIPHGSGVGPFSQLSAFARIRAVLVLPVPRGPVNRYACATRSSAIAFVSVRGDVLLPEDLVERLGPVLPIEREVSHPTPS